MFKWRVILSYYDGEKSIDTPEYHVDAECGDDAVELTKVRDGNNKKYNCVTFQVIEEL